MFDSNTPDPAGSEMTDNAFHQARFEQAQAPFKKEERQAEIEEIAEDAGKFVMANADRYDINSTLVRNEPIVNLGLLASIQNGTESYFLKGHNREVARKLVFSNALTHVLLALGERGIVREALIAESNDVVFKPGMEDFLADLERRRQSTALDARMSLEMITRRFYTSTEKKNKAKVRDGKLLVMASFGLVTSKYKNGEGWQFRAGPVLSATVTEAVEPFLAHHKL